MRGRKTQLGFAFTTLNLAFSKSAREKSEARHLREQAQANESFKKTSSMLALRHLSPASSRG